MNQDTLFYMPQDVLVFSIYLTSHNSEGAGLYLHPLAGMHRAQHRTFFRCTGVEIKLCGRDRAMSQKFLNEFDVDIRIQEERSKAVPEGMGGLRSFEFQPFPCIW